MKFVTNRTRGVKFSIERRIQNRRPDGHMSKDNHIVDIQRIIHLVPPNGVQPAGRIVSSMTVLRKTVVAKSFQGRPAQIKPTLDWQW